MRNDSKRSKDYRGQFHRKPNPSDEDFFIFTEVIDFLIKEQNNPRDMIHLGGVYYGRREFDLALKYYEMTSTFNIDAADECLGYIWYYGRTGDRDYEKAFRHYSRSMERGNPNPGLRYEETRLRAGKGQSNFRPSNGRGQVADSQDF